MSACQRAEFLYRFSRALHEQNLDLKKTLQTVISLTGEAIGVEHGCLVTFRDHQQIENAYIIGSKTADGIGRDVWEAMLKHGLVGFVYHSDRIVTIRNLKTDPRWPQVPQVSSFLKQGSAVGIPLQKGAYVYGVIILLSPQIDFFVDEKLSLLEEIGRTASLAIGNALDLHAARTSDARYQSLFEDAVVPIILTDTRGYVVDVNRKACEFLGYQRTELLRSPITFVHAMDADSLGPDKMRLLQRGEEVFFRTLAHTSHQHDKPVLVRARRIQLEGRTVIEWIEQDMTTQMELEQLRRDLTAMVYHDLRGPMQTILGSIYKLGDVLRNHENPAVLTLLQLGIRGTRQLERMVDSLLDVQRLEEGSAILDTKSVELRVLLTDAVQLMHPIAAQSNQRLHIEVEDHLPAALIDGDMIMRVVINLLQNACKYTPDEGTITLSAQNKGEHLLISVKDSGPGIPSNMKSQIFDKFSRVKYKGAPKGVGLGLAFCRLAVEAHGGQIWVESEIGHGAEFIFTLPTTSPQKPQEAETVEEIEAGSLATA